MPGDVSLWPNLTGGEAIGVLTRLRGGADPKRVDELLARFELDPTRRCRAYSKGNRQKVALVAALASDVELLLLDEPTSGLDPLMEHAFAEWLRSGRAARGVTVLLSCHVLSEVEALCDHVSIIKQGRVVETGTLAQLRHLTRLHLVADLDGAAPPTLGDLAGVHDVVVEGSRLACQVDEAALPPLLARLGTLPVRSLVSAPPTLEELFLRHYRTEPA